MKLGSLFSGYGGLDMAVESVFDAETVWVSDVEDAPCRILAHHWPTVPNLGDITRVDWERVEPVDIIAGGSPCQDLSAAGRRAGMKPGTRSGLWASMCDAIEIIKPRLVVWENVLGALSAEAIVGDVEQCEFCMDATGGGTAMRALGRVLGDLAEIGYDATWTSVRASDIGAPHHRERVFVLAAPAGVAYPVRGRSGRRDMYAPSCERKEPNVASSGTTQGSSLTSCLPTPRAGDCEHSPLSPAAARHVEAGNGALGEVLGALAVLPTPIASDYKRRVESGNWNGLNRALYDLSVLPTPSTMDTLPVRTGEAREKALHRGGESSRRARTANLREEIHFNFHEFEPAIRRWENLLGRPAPEPLETGPQGGTRQSPAFTEWMMGLPQGHVTGVPGIPWAKQLRALGNGVVPQQAAYAINRIYEITEKETANG